VRVGCDQLIGPRHDEMWKIRYSRIFSCGIIVDGVDLQYVGKSDAVPES
jgi:hypothetical protein